MTDYTLKNDTMDRVMHHSIDMAVNQAVTRFANDLPREFHSLVARIASAAAHTSVEQFRTYANSELRLIEIDHQQRYEKEYLRPIDMRIQAMKDEA